MQKHYIFILVLLIWGSCETETDKTAQAGMVNQEENALAGKKATWSASGFQFKYQLDNPSETFKLPKKLSEISGLSLSNDGEYLLAVNDEKGRVYFVNKKTGELDEEEKFAKSGDFEGVEEVGNKLYLVRSNGKINKITDRDEDTEVKFNTPLNSNHDVEGLGYDSQNNRLLLACKNRAGLDGKIKDKRAIYAFDLATEEMLEEPVYLIDRDSIKTYLKLSKRLVDGVLEIISPDEVSDAFAPSGIAEHPLTGNIYIVASVGKLLVVLSPSGTILHLEKLDRDYHKQPEGICFDKDGTLYISTEGRKGKGKIYRFNQ